MLSETLKTFGYPETVVREYQRWLVLLAPRQMTLGTLILAAKDGVTSVAELSDETFAQFPRVIREVEGTLRRTFHVDRFNYLWLMMANPEVHAAIIPRYASQRTFGGVTFNDPGWPKRPDTDVSHALEPAAFAALVSAIKTAFADVR